MHSDGNVHYLSWVHEGSTKFQLSFLQQGSYTVLFYFMHRVLGSPCRIKHDILKTNLNMVSCLHLISHDRTQRTGKHSQRILEGPVAKVVNHKLIMC